MLRENNSTPVLSRPESFKSAALNALCALAIVLIVFAVVIGSERPLWSAATWFALAAPVPEILRRLPETIELLGASMAIAIFFAIAVRSLRPMVHSGVVDFLDCGLIRALRCIPFFWLAAAAALLAAMRFGNSAFGVSSSAHFTFGDHLRHLAIPACALAIMQLPIVTAALRRTGGSLYASFDALAKRLPEVFAACFIVEMLFAWPGEGRMMMHYIVGPTVLEGGAEVVILVAAITLLISCIVSVVPSRSEICALEAMQGAFGIPYSVLAIGVAALFILSIAMRPYSNGIDNVHWNGYPLPPCFVNAATCGGHVLGTDEVGRDVLARLAVGAETSLGISLWAAAVELVIVGVVVYIVYRSKRLGPVAARVADGLSTLAAWPFLVVIAFMLFDSKLPQWGRLAALAAVGGIVMSARLVSLGIETFDARSIIHRLRTDWANLLLLIATIDFFGLGVQPPTASWGNMLANGQQNFSIAWWAAIFPAVCLFAAALAIRVGKISRVRHEDRAAP